MGAPDAHPAAGAGKKATATAAARLPALPAALRAAAGPARSPARPPALRAAAAGLAAALLVAAAPLAMTATPPTTAAASPEGETRAAGPAPAPARIVTLAPHATELVYAAGGGDHMVGTVTSSDFPAPARTLPRVGDGMTLNQEKLILLRPTLIFAWRPSGAAVQAEALAGRLGARMEYSAPARLRDIPAEVRRIGRLLGGEREADAAASAMEARIDALEARHSGGPPVTVFIEAGSRPLYTIGNDPLLNDALRVCGAVNVYGASPIAAPRVAVESVLVHDPRLIVAPARHEENGEAVLERWRGYGLRAAIEGRVHTADPDALFRPGPRLIDATEALCAAAEAARLDTRGLK